MFLGFAHVTNVRFSINWDDEENGGIPCLWFPAPKAATVILFFHANADPWNLSKCKKTLKINTWNPRMEVIGLEDHVPFSIGWLLGSSRYFFRRVFLDHIFCRDEIRRFNWSCFRDGGFNDYWLSTCTWRNDDPIWPADFQSGGSTTR